MRVQRIVAIAVVCSALIALPLSAALDKAAGSGGVLPSAPAGGALLLYDQTDNASGNGAPDQDFEAGFDAYDCMGADDFVVTDASGWTVQRVVTVGTQSAGGTPTSVDVTFYANSPGGGDTDLPGATVCSYPALIPTSGNASFTIDLPTDCVLPPGIHWVGIQANQNFGGGNGQHFWSNRTVQSGNESAWINPGNGFGSGCTTWTPQTTCGVGGGTNPDFLFQIYGQVGGLYEPPVIQEIPTLGTLGFAALLLLLAASAFWALRRARRA